MLGDKEQTKILRLDPKKSVLSGQIEVLMPSNALAYEYEINWFLKSGKVESTGKRPGETSLIFADTL
jgi:hypothetical protein